MKKRITYLLLCSFLINSVIYFILFPFLIHSFKERFESDRKDEKKSINRVIEINREDLKKINFVDKKEIIYEGKLYDILVQKEDSDKIIFYCYHDKEEEKALKTHDEYGQKEKTRLLNSIMAPGFAKIQDKELNEALLNKSTKLFNISAPVYSAVFLEIPNPPPNS